MAWRQKDQGIKNASKDVFDKEDLSQASTSKSNKRDTIEKVDDLKSNKQGDLKDGDVMNDKVEVKGEVKRGREKEKERNKEESVLIPGEVSNLKVLNAFESASSNDKVSLNYKDIVLQLERERVVESRSRVKDESIAAINPWEDAGVNMANVSRKIVNQIPSCIMISNVLSGGISSDVVLMNVSHDDPQVLKDSTQMFQSGTLEVTYRLKTVNAGSDIDYDSEASPVSDLKLEGYSITADAISVVDDFSKKRVLETLISLIFDLRRVGDVFIQDVPMTTFKDNHEVLNDDVMSVFAGKKVPNSMLPNMLLSTYRHSLRWFVDSVRGKIKTEDVILGEVGGVKMSSIGEKVYSYYGVFTDSIFSTLYEVHQQKHDAYSASAREVFDAVSRLSEFSGTIHPQVDLDAGVYQIFFPNGIHAEKYIFSFLISPAMRSVQYDYLKDLIIAMKGIRVKAPDEAFMGESRILDMGVNASGVNIVDLLLKGVKGLTFRHFVENLVINRAHAFLSVHGQFPSSIKSVFEAIIYLFMIMCDALIFPAVFWTFPYVYAQCIYDCIRVLSKTNYADMLKMGYTQSHLAPITLTKADILNGEIPRFFTHPGTMPKFVREYFYCLKPNGYMLDLPLQATSWSPKLNKSLSSYNQFMYVPRSIVGTAGDTPFFVSVNKFMGLVQSDMRRITKDHLSGGGLNGTMEVAMLSFLKSLEIMSRNFGATAHYELSVIIKNMLNGPEIPYDTYRGEMRVNTASYIGIISSSKSESGGILALDNPKFHCGAGLWAVMYLVGDHIHNENVQTNVNANTFQYQSPISRFEHHVQQVKNSIGIAEAFGIMSHILTEVEEKREGGWRFLTNLLGMRIKSGIAFQVLQWLCKGLDLANLFKGSSEGDVPLNSLDYRLYLPCVSRLSLSRGMLEPSSSDNDLFNRPLTLIDPFEIRKIEIALSLVSNMESPLHRYTLNVTVARELFNNISPINKHSPPDIELEYKPELFVIELKGSESKVAFVYNDAKWFDLSQVNFPEKVRIIITNPSIIPQDYWAFIEVCIEAKQWQLHFMDILVLARVKRVPRDRLLDSKYIDTFTNRTSWHVFKHAKLGSIVPVEFFDTSHDLNNPNYSVSALSYPQYICAVSPIERNVLARSIVSLYATESYKPPDPRNWTLGKRMPNEIPLQSNGVPKYLSNAIGFNNLVRVWTKNAKFDILPPMQYVPPSTNFLR